MFRRNKIILVILIALAVSTGSYLLYGKEELAVREISESRPENTPAAKGETIQESTSEQTEVRLEEKKAALPEKAFIGVPFLVQAPFAIWDPLHEDACEEASLIMVKYFLDNKNLTPTTGDVEIRKMIQYEDKNGYGLDVNMEQMNQIARDYFGLKTGRVKNQATLDDIKKEIAEGRPVIVPAAGKILPNPYFRDGGPDYHMLVVIGYDKNGFITNDPGTKRGEGFHYTFNGLYNAIHDWNENDIYSGEKAYLVFD